MRKHNGTQLYGIQKFLTTLKMGMNKELKKLSIDNRSMPLLFTTGYKLTRQRVKDLKSAGLEIPVISLDHYKAEVHDKDRRKEGIFDDAPKAINLFQDEGFNVAVAFVPDKPLVSDRKEIFKAIEFFKDIGIIDMRLTSPILSGELTTKPEEMLSPENVPTIFEIQKMCTCTKGYPGVFAYHEKRLPEFYKRMGFPLEVVSKPRITSKDPPESD